MENTLAKRKIDCREFRKTDIVDWLYSLGYEPIKINDHTAMYLSFFRPETTGSLKVNRKLQLFIDFGDTKFQGDIIKLGCFLFKTDVKALLNYLNNGDFSFRQHDVSKSNLIEESGIKIIQIEEITKPEIIAYIKKRCISIDIAKLYCKQVTYSCKGNNFCAIGLKNQSNEWEIRSYDSVFKAATKKDISVIKNNVDNKTVALFEGMFDMLSFMEMTPNFKELDFICLNSINLLPRALPLLIEYKTVLTYFDNDPQGKASSGVVAGIGLSLCRNMSLELKEKDLNEHLVVSRSLTASIQRERTFDLEPRSRGLSM